MKTTKKLFTMMCAILICTGAFAQKSKTMPVTTKSKEALKTYQEAMTAWEKVYFKKALELFDKAIVADPDFFMPYFQSAIFNLDFKNDEGFKKYATKAVAIKDKLSDGEELYREVLGRFLKDPKSDVTDLGAKTIELYPKDPFTYAYQGFFCNFVNEPEKAVEALKSAVKVAKNKAPFYNMLGYNYMAVKQMNEAEKAFNKYIKLAPDQPNPYDSKGDYFMAIKEYQNAYDSFMKAYNIDSENFANSKKKAEKAKQLMVTASDD